jgi:Ca2+-binding RTX toxin-like protein
VALLNDGGFVLAYADNEYGMGQEVHAHVFNADGSPRSDIGIANDFTAGDQNKPTLTLMSNGFFALGWLNQGLLKVQAFDANGDQWGGQVDQGGMIDANIAGLPDGRLVNVRSSTAPDGGGDASIRMNAFDLVRTTLGDATGETLDGDALIDVMDGAGGADSLSGFGAPDTIGGGDGADTLRGGAGDDQIDGGLEKDRLRGDADDDRLTGGDANDRLDGGSGTDTLLGGAANDELVGGQGGDVLRGGAGADLFLYNETAESVGKARDRIADLASGDLVDLSEIDANETNGGNDAFQIVAMFSDTPGEIILRYSAGKDRTTLRADTDGDSIAELVIIMDGDQTGFGGFVL